MIDDCFITMSTTAAAATKTCKKETPPPPKKLKSEIVKAEKHYTLVDRNVEKYEREEQKKAYLSQISSQQAIWSTKQGRLVKLLERLDIRISKLSKEIKSLSIMLRAKTPNSELYESERRLLLYRVQKLATAQNQYNTLSEIFLREMEKERRSIQ